VRDAAREKPREFASGFYRFGLVAFAPDGKHLLSLFELNSDGLALSALATGEPIRLFWGGGDELTCVAFSPDGKLLAAGSAKGRVRLWTVGGWLVHAMDGHKGPIWSLSFAADGKTLATAGEDGTARLWELATGKERARLTGHHGRVLAVAFGPDGNTLATGGSDGRALLWNLSEWGRMEEMGRLADR
jgi:WD40 repeat protein